jgi:hypothetical protein
VLTAFEMKQGTSILLTVILASSCTQSLFVMCQLCERMIAFILCSVTHTQCPHDRCSMKLQERKHAIMIAFILCSVTQILSVLMTVAP